jgi:hypothetical protein
VSTGGHYADVQSRYDWLTLNHFAAVSSNGNYGVTLSNQDCYFMQTGNSTIQSLDENTARIKVLVGGRVDGLGMNTQDNDSVFNQRYAISAYNTYSAVSSMKSSLEHQNGFASAYINNTSGYLLPATNFSFMKISDPNTLLWALKPAEEGMAVNGAIVRVWNLANTTANTNFTFYDLLTSAKNITHIETDISDASFSNKTLSTSVGKNQLKSYRIKITAVSSPPPIKPAEFRQVNDILLYPNPVQNQLEFQLMLDKQSRYDVWINDITGKTVLKLPPHVFQAGNNYFTINTSKLPKQIYTLIVQNGEKKYTRKFVKN